MTAPAPGFSLRLALAAAATVAKKKIQTIFNRTKS